MKTTHFLYLTLLITLTFTACRDIREDSGDDIGLSIRPLLTARNWTIKSVIDEADDKDVTEDYLGRKLQFYNDDTYTHNLIADIETGTYSIGGGSSMGGESIILTPNPGRVFVSKLEEVKVAFSQLHFKVILHTSTRDIVLSIEME